MKKITTALLLSSFVLATGTAHAGGYVGLSVGHADYPGEFDNSISYSVKGGYEISENFAFELGYVNFGKAKDDLTSAEAEVTGVNTSIVGIAPLNPNLDVFVKVGVIFWNVDVSVDGLGRFVDDNGTDLSFGFGGAYHVTDDISVATEYQRFDIDGGDIDNFSVGLHLYF